MRQKVKKSDRKNKDKEKERKNEVRKNKKETRTSNSAASHGKDYNLNDKKEVLCLCNPHFRSKAPL